MGVGAERLRPPSWGTGLRGGDVPLPLKKKYFEYLRVQMQVHAAFCAHFEVYLLKKFDILLKKYDKFHN